MAKYYFLGWASLSVGLIIFLLENTGHLPYNAFTAYAFMVGIGLDAVILSLAIIHRFKVMKTKSDESAVLSYELLKQNEALIREKNKELEQKVQEQKDQLQSALSMFNSSEDKLKEYAMQLEKSNRELTDFAHIASHDLKAPIRGIMSFTQLFERRNAAKFDDIDREYFNFIKTNAKQSARLIEDVLNYSKIDKNLGEPDNIDLNECLYSVELNLKTLIQEKNAQIIFGPLPILRGHSSLLNQLFQNLVANGIKYNKSNTPTITISSKKDEKGQYVFYVKDNGIGIAAENQKAVFAMFRRLHTQAEYEGSGIGLAFCSRIVDTYGGQIGLTSEAGEGTTFFFTLPKAPVVRRENAKEVSLV